MQQKGALSAYAFVEAGEAGALRDAGALAWWSHSDLKLHFFRPGASALLALDVHLFGESSWAAHVHSLAWFALLLWLASRIFARVLKPRDAFLATLIYALCGAHALPVTWLAARHVLVAAVCSLAAVLIYLRARAEQWTAGSWLVIGVLAAGLGCSEASLGGVAMIASLELFGAERDDERFPKRVLRIAPLAGLAALYLVAYVSGNYGAQHSGVYMHPLTDLPAYLSELPLRFGALSAAALLAIPSVLYSLDARIAPVLVGLGWFAVAAISVMARRTRLNQAHGWPAVRGLLIGGGLAVVISVAGVLGDRLLVVVMLGPAALLARLISELRIGGRAARAGVWGLLVLHLGFAPVVRSVTAFRMIRATDLGETLMGAFPECDEVRLLNAADPVVHGVSPVAPAFGPRSECTSLSVAVWRASRCERRTSKRDHAYHPCDRGAAHYALRAKSDRSLSRCAGSASRFASRGVGLEWGGAPTCTLHVRCRLPCLGPG